MLHKHLRDHRRDPTGQEGARCRGRETLDRGTFTGAGLQAAVLKRIEPAPVCDLRCGKFDRQRGVQVGVHVRVMSFVLRPLFGRGSIASWCSRSARKLAGILSVVFVCLLRTAPHLSSRRRGRSGGVLPAMEGREWKPHPRREARGAERVNPPAQQCRKTELGELGLRASRSPASQGLVPNRPRGRAVGPGGAGPFPLGREAKRRRGGRQPAPGGGKASAISQLDRPSTTILRKSSARPARPPAQGQTPFPAPGSSLAAASLDRRCKSGRSDAPGLSPRRRCYGWP